MTIFQHIHEIFRSKQNPTILEIGSCCCEDTYDIILNANLRSRKFKYYAFEPEPKNIDIIKKENVYHYITLVEKAIGSFNGKSKFYQSSGNINPDGPSWHGSGSILEPKNHLDAFPWCKFDTSTEIDVITLDTFFEEQKLDHVDFIWCDVQGAESDVVIGGQKTLAKTHYFYSEFNDNEMYRGQTKLDQWMAKLPGKWLLVEKWPHDVLLKNEDYND